MPQIPVRLLLKLTELALPTIAKLTHVPPAYIPVIQQGIELAEGPNGFGSSEGQTLKGDDKLQAAINHVVNNPPQNASGGPAAPSPTLGQMSDAISGAVDIANSLATLGGVLNKF
jgi:hypothetical protein